MSDIDASLETQARVDAAAIERHLRLHYAAAMASLKAAQIVPSGCRLTLHLLNPKTEESRAHHFRLSAQGLAGAIREATTSAEAGFNVYAKLVANRFGMNKAQPGTRHDWHAILGFTVDLDGYKDGRGGVDSLPLHPSLLIQTSSEPVPSAQAFFYLSQGVGRSDAELADAIAWGLAQIINDKDGGTANIVQSWRVAGTLNYPTEPKIKAGRPAHPQRVQLLPDGTEKLYTHAELVDAIEVDLGLDQPLVEAYRAATTVKKSNGTTAAQSEPTAQGQLSKCWDGDPRHLRRDLDALESIPSDIDYAIWKKVVGAWAARYGETDFGKEIARLWCVGGTYEHITFRGAPDRFVEEDFNKLWDACGRGKLGYNIGTLYWLAHDIARWDKSLARWGLGYERPAVPLPVELPPQAQAVLAAAEAFPKEHPQLAVAAWFYQATLMDVGADLLRVLSDIGVLIHRQSGYAIVEPSYVMSIRKWLPTAREIQKREPSLQARRHLNHAERLRLIARTSGSSIGAHGRRGQTVALTLPNGMSWEEAIETFKAAYKQPITAAQEASNNTPSAHPLIGHNGGPATQDYNFVAPLQSDGWDRSTPQNKTCAPLHSDGSSYTVELQSGVGLPDGSAEVSQLEAGEVAEVLRQFPMFSLLPPELILVLERARGKLAHATSLHGVMIAATRKGVDPADIGVIVHEVFEEYVLWLKGKNKQLDSEPPSKVFERIHDNVVLRLKESGLHHSRIYSNAYNKREKMIEAWKRKQASKPPRADGKPDLKIVSSNDDGVA